MRISTIQTFNEGVASMQRVAGLAADTQAQISSGRKFLSPADDPVAATRILQLNQDIATREVYQRNIDSVTNRLSLEDTLLDGVGSLVQRVRELTVQAGNGSYSVDDRKFLAAEIESRLEEMVGLVNSRDASGEFVFAGFKGGTTPFATGGGGGYRYHGDEGERDIQVGPSTFIRSGDHGKKIFEDLPAATRGVVTSDNPRNTAVPPAHITVGRIADPDVFADFYPSDAIIEFEDPGALDPPAANFTVRRASDGRVIEGMQNEPFAPGVEIQFAGISVRIAGQPEAGDSFMIESSERQGLLTTVAQLAEGLKLIADTDIGREQLGALVEDSLNNLDTAETRLLETRSSVGARLNTLESTRSLHEEVDLKSREILSELQDVDFAEAVSRLSLETFVLEAAQQSFARIANLSLINRLG